jgi:hypothetical protein
VPRPEKESATTSSETAVESAAAPLKAKGVATGSSKRKSVAVPPLESVGKQATSSKFGKKSVALRPFKDQRKPTTSSSSPDEEQPSTVLARSPPKKKKSVVPPPPSGAATRTRSKSASIIGRMSSKVSPLFFSIFFFYLLLLFAFLCGIFLFFYLRQATHKPGRPSGAVIVVEVTLTHSFCFDLSLG